MPSTITKEQEKAICLFLKYKHIPRGLGTKEEACSIAAINLALTGVLTDNIPDCMSKVIGRWIIKIQDRMPDSIRNSKEWRQLLPLAAGTGRNNELERRNIILDWMWNDVLPTLQKLADKKGFGKQWKLMCTNKNSKSAAYATDAADAVAVAANAAAAAADAADAAAAYATDAAAAYATDAADAVAAAADAAAADAAWTLFNPCLLLRKLIEVTIPIEYLSDICE